MRFRIEKRNADDQVSIDITENAEPVAHFSLLWEEAEVLGRLLEGISRCGEVGIDIFLDSEFVADDEGQEPDHG